MGHVMGFTGEISGDQLAMTALEMEPKAALREFEKVTELGCSVSLW